MKKILFFIGIVLLFIACTNEINRHVIEVHENGAPKLVSYYMPDDNDSILVKDEWYYDDSTLRMAGSYIDGLKSGVWEAWYDDGTLWSSGEFLEGKAHGYRTVYHENGNIYYNGHYTKGVRSGHWEFFSLQGVKENEIDY